MVELPFHRAPNSGAYFDDDIAKISASHWKSLRYFLFYRFCIAWILLVFLLLDTRSLPQILASKTDVSWFIVTLFYLGATGASLIVRRYYNSRFNLQLSLHVLIDVIAFSLLIHLGEGMRVTLGAIMLISLAGACLVGHGVLVLFYAALASVAILLGELFKTLIYGFELVDLFQAGIFSACFFGVGISAHLIAKHLLAQEILAQKHQIALDNQTRINQRIIEEMHDGVLVLDQNGKVSQCNPCAERLLGLSDPQDRELHHCSPELASRFFLWRDHPADEHVLFRAPLSGANLSARFIPTKSSEHDVLVLLEDADHIQKQLRQLKLAALGRLTANIAHEIRNPLSAISHAGALLREKTPEERLTRIILDNTLRVDRIVSNILELGRRDKIFQETLNLRLILPNLVEEYHGRTHEVSDMVHFEISGSATLLFDRVHFHQVIWNLLGNALRYSRKTSGSVRFVVHDDTRTGGVRLHVRDDGAGIDPILREQIFEPFFTTHSQGIGLGLYIARELCEANGARIELMDSPTGADFCILGKSTI